jgi:hypothetical protein
MTSGGSREADAEHTDLETVIQDLLEERYSNPIGVFGFNPTECWSQDVSHDVALELRRRCDLQLSDVPSSIQDSSNATKAVIAGN